MAGGVAAGEGRGGQGLSGGHRVRPGELPHVREGWGQDWVGGIPHGLESRGREGLDRRESSYKVREHIHFLPLAMVLPAFLSAYEALVSVSGFCSIPAPPTLTAVQEVVHSCRELLGHFEAITPGFGGGLSRLRRLTLHGYVDGSGDVDELVKVWCGRILLLGCGHSGACRACEEDGYRVCGKRVH